MQSLTSPIQDAAALAARLATREARIRLLEEENRWLKAQLYGRSSERRPAEDRAPEQAWLFNEAEALAAAVLEEPATITIPAHDRAKRSRKPLAAHLPRIEVLHDLADEQKRCPHDGTPLERIGEETAEQLEFIPARLRVLRHVRPKYACPCCRQGVHIAPAPPAIFPKSLATPSLLAQITTAKFVDGVPLYRQEPQFGRLGIRLSRATMALWMIRLGGRLLVPLINLLNELMLAESVIHCDETRLQVLRSDKAPTADHWIWVRAAGPPGRRIVLFDYDASRGGAVPQRLLDGFSGVLVTDGYAAYDGAAAALKLTHAGCMAHVRRYFEEAREVGTDASTATAALAPRVLPESRLGKAVHYALGQWPKLGVFLTHGDVPLTNNRCENAIRPFVVGRKGWLFSDTVPGARASANLYSLVETAKANGVEPFAYLTALFERLPHLQTVADFEAVLPWSAGIAPPR